MSQTFTETVIARCLRVRDWMLKNFLTFKLPMFADMDIGSFFYARNSIGKS